MKGLGMCELCNNHLTYAQIKGGWLYLIEEGDSDAVITFPIEYCPWCSKKITEQRMMPKITPRDWKYQMQEQEAENANS
jgi:hypothetical protein